MRTRYECRWCCKISHSPGTCCGVAMRKATVDESILWPVVALYPTTQADAAESRAV